MFLFLILSCLSFNLYAQQSGGGGGSDLKGTCELSGGTFTGSEGGNWACCWSDWGCYGCVDGNCKMQCRTQRCRKANGASAISNNNPSIKGTAVVKGLAPTGTTSPIAPVKVMKKLPKASMSQ